MVPLQLWQFIKVKRRELGIGFVSGVVGYLCLEERSDAGPFLLEQGNLHSPGCCFSLKLGGRGPLAQEEARLLEIRVRKEKEFDEEVRELDRDLNHIFVLFPRS